MSRVEEGTLGTHALYDPAKARADVARHLAQHIAVGAEIVRESADLLLRMFQSSSRDITDTVLISHFYRALVVAADGCLICLEAGAAEQALLHTRKAFEAGLSLQWIVTEASDSRARRFYVWHLRQERSWLERAVPGTEEHEEHRSAWAAENDPGPPLDEATCRSRIDEINAHLANAPFNETNALFDAARVPRRGSARRKPEPPWHGVGADGHRSIAALATAVGRRTEYRSIYRHLSYATHSSSLTASRRIEAGMQILEHIRIPRHFSTAFTFAFAELMHRSLNMLNRYRPGEIERYVPRMRDQWLPIVTKWLDLTFDTR